MRFSSPAIVTPVDANLIQWKGDVPADLHATFVQSDVRHWLAVTADALGTLKDQRQVSPGSFFIPATGAGIAVPSGAGANTYGAWVEMDAAVGADILILGVRFRQLGSVNDPMMDLGIGAAASEVSTGENPAFILASGQALFVPFNKPIPVANGLRLAARTRDSSGSANNHELILYAINETDLEAIDA